MKSAYPWVVMMNTDKTMTLLYALLLLIMLIGCNQSVSHKELSDELYDRLAISNRDKLSAASKRAIERNYDQGPQWYCEFKVHDLKGDFKYEEGVTRRDPSAIITVDGTYYVYYTRATGKTYGFGTPDPEKKVFPWDKAEIWYATSKDGWDWKEQGLAVGRGQVLMMTGLYLRRKY